MTHIHATAKELMQRRGKDVNDPETYDKFYRYVVAVDKSNKAMGSSRPHDPLERVTDAILAKHRSAECVMK